VLGPPSLPAGAKAWCFDQGSENDDAKESSEVALNAAATQVREPRNSSPTRYAFVNSAVISGGSNGVAPSCDAT